MKRFRTTTLAAALGSVLGAGLLLPAVVQAADPSLLQLIERQSAQIDALQQRLSALESGTGGGAKAEIEALHEEIEALQLQISQMSLGQGSSQGSTNGPTSWRRGGPEFRSADGFYRLHLRGRVMLDYSATSGSDFDARNINGTEMRAIRLGAQGQAGALRYKIDADFADQEVSVKDAWIGWGWRSLGLPMELFLGNRLKDRSIDGASTISRTPFMERNAVAQLGASVNGYYGLGANYKVYGRNWHLGASIAGDQIDNAGSDSDSITYTVRGHVNPVKTGAGFLHLGSWYYYEELAGDVASVNNAPRIGGNFNDNLRVSGSAIANPKRNEAYGLELGGVYRSLWGMAEMTERRLVAGIGPQDLNRRVDREAWSVSAGWLITGERPGFSSRSGIWGSTRVLRPVTEGGIGAFELAVRADRYDFRDPHTNGGDGRRTTVGLNWYLNNHARVMLNYVDWSTDNRVGAYQGPDSGRTIGLRTQVTF